MDLQYSHQVPFSHKEVSTFCVHVDDGQFICVHPNNYPY